MSKRPTLPGIHSVLKTKADGSVVLYCYRNRGGPRIGRFAGSTRALAERQMREGSSELWQAYSKAPKPSGPKKDTFKSVVAAYRSSPEFEKLKDSTKRQWRRWLDRIEEEFGHYPIAVMDDPKVSIDLRQWLRSWSSKPRSYDYGLQVLRRLLRWAVRERLLKDNHTSVIESIYKSDRSHIVFEEDEIAAILGRCAPAAALGIRLAALTGMRRGDLVTLTWDHVEADMLRFRTSKSGRMREAIYPLTVASRALVQELRKHREQLVSQGYEVDNTVLLTARGKRWNADSLSQAFHRERDALGLGDKNFHDLRGTAATRFVKAGLSDVEVAEIMGWTTSRVHDIRRRYVARNKVNAATAAKLDAFEKGTAAASL